MEGAGLNPCAVRVLMAGAGSKCAQWWRCAGRSRAQQWPYAGGDDRSRAVPVAMCWRHSARQRSRRPQGPGWWLPPVTPSLTPLPATTKPPKKPPAITIRIEGSYKTRVHGLRLDLVGLRPCISLTTSSQTCRSPVSPHLQRCDTGGEGRLTMHARGPA